MKRLIPYVWAVFFLLLSVALVWASGGEGGMEEAAPHGVTHEQIMNFVWFSMNFVVFCIIVWKWVRPPVVAMFKERQENIVRQYNELLERKKEAEAKYIELQEKIKNLEKEAKEIYENYVAQGMKEKERIIKEAEEQAARIKQQAELYIQQEMEKARKMLREELAEASVRLAEEILRKNFTEEDQKRIYQEFINDLRGRVVH